MAVATSLHGRHGKRRPSRCSYFDTDNGGSDQTYSCPLVYSWDGQRWRLDSGTFGGAIMPALARTEVDNLLHAVPVGDSLRLRITNELNETDHLDRGRSGRRPPGRRRGCA